MGLRILHITAGFVMDPELKSVGEKEKNNFYSLHAYAKIVISTQII